MVCEGLRHEVRNLVSLLGFYGVIPHVEIYIKDFSLPIEHLMFVLRDQVIKAGRVKMSIQIVDQAGTAIFSPPEKSLELPVVLGGTNFAFAIDKLKFAGPGTYAFVLRVDGNDTYHGKFEIVKEKPQASR